ncbi:MAG: TonB-dependent receptor [Planctomycetes bacterium]|nr:TonB-dependent receptor [Planctomycetota bacterium]
MKARLTCRTVSRLTTASVFALAGCAALRPPPQEPPPAARATQEPAATERVVVTARKWEESPADVPRSVTAITSEMIRDRGATTIRDLAGYVPNMLLTEFTARRLSFPFVRGVGSGQGEPAVATFVDGVPQLTVSSTNLELVDVERVEFLRGPFGALYGRNTIGGAIHVISKTPPEQPRIDAGATLGNYGSQAYDLAVGGPVAGDELAASFAGRYSRRDGYTTNDFTNDDVDSRDSYFGRAQLLWEPDQDTRLRFVVYGERSRDGGFVLSNLAGLRADPYRINQDFEGETSRDILASSLTWNEYGDDVDFVSITSLQGWQIAESADFDFSALDGVRRFTAEDQDYVYQEVRFESAPGSNVALGDDVQLRWLVGASGFHSDSSRAATNEFRAGGAGILFPPAMVGSDRVTGDFADWSASLFGQAALLFGDGFEVSAALRYDFESRSADIDRVFDSNGLVVPVSSTRDDETFDEVLPRGSVAYRFSENVKGYVLAARGFKAGGFNLSAPAGSEAFGPETSWTYEAGVKTEWLDERVTANLAVFHVDWDDMQLSQFDANAGGYVTNAGRSTSEGIELEVGAEPLDEFAVSAALGLLQTGFDEFVDQYGQDAAGNSLPFAPAMTLGLGVQYTHAIDESAAGFARVDFFHVGEYFYDAGNRESARYSVTDLRIGVRGDHWRLDGFLANAFDEVYVPIAFQPSPADPSVFVGQNGAPRTFGFSLLVTF